MKGEKRIIAAMAFALASHVVIPASAGDSTVWHFQHGQWVPLATFASEAACARAAQTLAEKSGAHLRCEPSTAARRSPASTPEDEANETWLRQMERLRNTSD